jgi:hypothetical protein
MMGKKMYRQRLEEGSVDLEDLRTKIAASLFNEEPFEPVFLIEDKRIRLTGFEITEGKLVARFVPVK